MDIPSKRITFGVTDYSDDNESYVVLLSRRVARSLWTALPFLPFLPLDGFNSSLDSEEFEAIGLIREYSMKRVQKLTN